MFERIVIDISSYPMSQITDGQSESISQELRLLSCFYLVSNEVVEISRSIEHDPRQSVLPFVEADSWQPIVTPNEGSNDIRGYVFADKRHAQRMRSDHFNDTIAIRIDQKLGFESYSLKNRAGARYLLPIANGGDMLMSTDHELKLEFLGKNPKSSRTAVLALAAAGIEIGLPRVRLDISRREEYLRVKETLEEERLAYLIAISQYADEALDRLRANPNLETIIWAQDQAERKILPRVVELELALKRQSKSRLERLKAAFIETVIPAVGSTLSNLDTPYQKAVILDKLLQIFSTELAQQRILKRFPEASYQVGLSRRLSTP